jgi:hypothetical protein
MSMCPIDLPAIEEGEAVRADVPYHRRAKSAPSWRESIRPRLLAGAALFAIPLFVYLLMSFPDPLQPAFTTTEAVLALVLLGLVISRP